jgi:hypothetical protein
MPTDHTPGEWPDDDMPPSTDDPERREIEKALMSSLCPPEWGYVAPPSPPATGPELSADAFTPEDVCRMFGIDVYHAGYKRSVALASRLLRFGDDRLAAALARAETAEQEIALLRRQLDSVGLLGWELRGERDEWKARAEQAEAETDRLVAVLDTIERQIEAHFAAGGKTWRNSEVQFGDLARMLPEELGRLRRVEADRDAAWIEDGVAAGAKIARIEELEAEVERLTDTIRSAIYSAEKMGIDRHRGTDIPREFMVILRSSIAVVDES